MVVLVVPMVVLVLVLSCVILVPGSCPTPPPQPPYQPLAGLIVHTCNGALQELRLHASCYSSTALNP